MVDHLSRPIQVLFLKDSRCGMLIPRPQYPLYSAALTMVGGRIVYYDMHEEKGWRTSLESLESSAKEAIQQGAELRDARKLGAKRMALFIGSFAGVADVLHFFFMVFLGFCRVFFSCFSLNPTCFSMRFSCFPPLSRRSPAPFRELYKAITVINPGNPVGAVLDREDVVMLIQFATEQKLVILADEAPNELST